MSRRKRELTFSALITIVCSISIIVLAPFVAAVGPIERVLLQLISSAALLGIGFLFGAKLDEE